MPFYAFRLVRLDIKYQRGKLPDNDLVTFSVFVNQNERGRGAGMFPALTTGASIPVVAVPVGNRSGNMMGQWVVGPLELGPNDAITLIYSGQNTSDSQLDDEQSAELELKVLDMLTSAVVGAVGLGLIGSAISTALGLVGDPIGKFLGWSPQGPCNGLVFQDTVQLTGGGIQNLPFGPHGSDLAGNDLPLHAIVDRAIEYFYTRSYTDEASHNTDICGHIAETDVTFSVLQIPDVWVTPLAKYLYLGTDFKKGLGQILGPGKTLSLRQALRLRP